MRSCVCTSPLCARDPLHGGHPSSVRCCSLVSLNRGQGMRLHGQLRCRRILFLPSSWSCVLYMDTFNTYPKALEKITCTSCWC
ncbi:hypothetical protein CORC01_06581 [Colletotrichum orchidophilum]|uniref:Uncharacterized protein n=1 Tax=Colletotrichum orchidophilum TaxID=1209926 RepID=A0A1G4B9H7_9PEZI|nr:uncharacterized protein CORC01_06581 [Colletotrichum orchidophilum]OHE98067.1 hypothetical protein CORC01_06581 [Colletotrichum orchidophilum]